jgi:hypothetical protein
VEIVKVHSIDKDLQGEAKAWIAKEIFVVLPWVEVGTAEDLEIEAGTAGDLQ